MSVSQNLDWLTTPITALFIPLRLPFSEVNRLTSQQFSFLKDIPNQGRLIKDLQRQNAALSVQAQQTEQLKVENEALKKIIRSPIAVRHSLLPVKVIGIARFAYIDHGSNHGLKTGQPAISDDTLIGIVDSVSANNARVMLLTDSNLTLSATTSLASTGTLTFTSNHLVIKEVLQKQPLQVDDRVFTAGTEQIPANLLIGTIQQIDSDPSAVYQTGIIKPALTLADHQTLFVILD